MPRIIPLIFTVLLLFSAGTELFSYEVDTEELEVEDPEDVEFINYRGPHEDIDSIEEIKGIGEFLGRYISPEYAEFSYFEKYRVIHAVDPEEETGLDADVFILEEGAAVDHIDNLRRIIGAYLSSAYAYSEQDAALIAEFITIYNAVYRQNMEFFSGRYKEVVLQHLTDEGVGIALHYREWPGNTEMLIPLSREAERGDLGAIEAKEVTEDAVIEELRTRKDMGIQTRKDMVDLKERMIEEEEEEISARRQDLEEEQREIEEAEEEIAQERDEIEEERAQLEEAEDISEEEAEAIEEELAEREEELAEQEEELEERQDAAEEEEEEIEEREEELEEDIADVQEDREEIARDQADLIEAEAAEEEEEAEEEAEAVQEFEEEPVGVPFLLLGEGSPPRGKVVLINSVTGEILKSSGLETISGRTLLKLRRGLYAIAADSMTADTGNLVLIDETSLEESDRSDVVVFAESTVSYFENEIYAVVKETGDWYLGRFNTNLDLNLRSSIAVNPYTYLSFRDNSVYVQTSDGRPVVLLLDDLKIAPK